jgi:hypothetical protein
VIERLKDLLAIRCENVERYRKYPHWTEEIPTIPMHGLENIEFIDRLLFIFELKKLCKIRGSLLNEGHHSAL